METYRGTGERGREDSNTHSPHSPVTTNMFVIFEIQEFPPQTIGSYHRYHRITNMEQLKTPIEIVIYNVNVRQNKRHF